MATLVGMVAAAPLAAQHAGHGGQSAMPRPTRDSGKAPSSAPAVFAPQESPGQVSLTLAPYWTDGRLVVRLAAKTDSGDLAEIDLARALTVIVNGTRVAPDSAGTLSGHHARAVVAFKVPTRPDAFVLQVQGVPDVAHRELRWPTEDSRAP